MVNSDDDFDQLAESLENEKFDVKIGVKGQLSTSHSNPRALKKRDFFNEFSLKIGGKIALELIERFRNFNNGNKEQKAMADGVLSTLIHSHGFGRKVLQDVFEIGTSRYNRVKKGVGKNTEYSRLNGSEVTAEMIKVLSNFVEKLTVELGYPCQHRRMKKYIAEEGIDTWQKLYDKYVQFTSDLKLEVRVMKAITFYKYVKAYHVDLAFTRAKEDCCDTCIRLEIAAADPNLDNEENKLVLDAQKLNNSDARIQRLALKSAIKLWGQSSVGSTLSPQQLKDFEDAVDSLPESNEEDLSKIPQYLKVVTTWSPNVRLQCEDYGGNLFLPHFGRKRPGRDFYVSNLSFHIFIISNMSTGINYVYLYDERAMGKGCDALCSLRWLYHMRLHEERRLLSSSVSNPDTLYLVMDNCVGQNKSQVTCLANWSL
jgi:hypothetical protein